MAGDKIAVVVVTYNRSALLQECLDAIERQTFRDYVIVLIDNHSTDDTPQLMAQRQQREPRLKYYRLESNVGGAGGYAEGIRRAKAEQCNYVWLMDDDTVCRPDALARLLAAADRAGTFGYLAGNVLWTDLTPCKMNLPLYRKQSAADSFRPVRKATFVSLLLPWQVIEKYGLPIKEFFIWGDDQEYTDRISRTMPCYFVPDSVVIHKTATNCGSDIIFDGIGRIGRYYYKYRNEFYISRHTGVASFGYYCYRLVRDTFEVLLHSNNKMQRIGIIWKGFAAGFAFDPVVEFVS